MGKESIIIKTECIEHHRGSAKYPYPACRRPQQDDKAGRKKADK